MDLGLSEEQQLLVGGFERLFEACARLSEESGDLAKRGVHVLLSNSSAPWVRELYRDFEIVEVRARRAVNCRPGGRGEVAELLIR